MTTIQSKATTPLYRDGWDRVFGGGVAFETSTECIVCGAESTLVLCDHCAARHTKRLDYNRLADDQTFNGWGFEDLLRKLVYDAALQAYGCDCGNRKTCYHMAAAGLRGLMRIIEHPDDCPECQRIAEQDRKARDGHGQE